MIGTTGEVATALSTGRDWWVRGEALDLTQYYQVSTAIEMKALGKKTTGVAGGDKPDPVIRYEIWRILGLGADNLILFNEDAILNPDLSLPEVSRDLTAAMLPLLRGVGGLFAASQPADDGVFVLTSADSSSVLAIHGYETLGKWNSGDAPQRVDLGTDSGDGMFGAREGVHDLLAGMGIGWRAISPTDVETGALERNGARLLILPLCAGLSDAACEAISRWVERGGRLIADLLPGTFTAHGMMRGSSITQEGALVASTNPLDEVFGLIPGARPPAVNKVNPNVWTKIGLASGAAFPVRCVDEPATVPPPPQSTVQSTGRSDAGVPVWFRNSYHQGQAVYLACSLFADYLPKYVTSNPTTAEVILWRANRYQIEEAFADLLGSLLGTEPHAKVVDRAGTRAHLCQFAVRSVGAAELILLMRDPIGSFDPVAPEVDCELRFRAVAHTYDLDNGIYLGNGDRLQLRISAYTFRAFARLPYYVDGIDVQVPGNSQVGDTLIVTATLRVANAVPHGHRLRLDVLDGSGRSLRYLAQEQIATDGTAAFSIPTALNDPPGLWSIAVTDIMTGNQTKVSVELGPNVVYVLEPEPLQIEAVDD
jgi:hypothetical protein